MLESPTFWTLVAFVIFLGLTVKPISKLAATALDARSDKIRAEIEEGEKLLEEAQELLSTYERKQRDSAKEAEAILIHAREESERMKTHAAENLEKSLARREKLAEERITQAEAGAIDEVRAVVAEIALDATRRLLAENLSADKSDALVDAAIKEIPAKLN
ncbi:MAG: F0F1 ATP synthase subunit B [Rhodospirillaceae bacterium]|jgi:F-type H+-transporting ATPase subunit b|nr:F0F1 ATP synthase subunit B [Rhodospirillaceae bacterium]MBT4700631.1 F0F1 ATP synthase subunit B [Rhodospirillaceae bacterium]MBT5036612.1 F0F1 ATP synthase subunit B [Rhodospirillaceae bacterium]MBT6221300.1 F0F1 ATP synthase subunit B [Rhodospirillaceae bacterium]MBT6361195.1 F0F1 ATP synthase subunit B [Rhodospirillaceae bacterium]